MPFTESGYSGRLTQFMAALGEQKERLAILLRSLSGLGATENMKPSVFRRFMLTMAQIAEAKDAERDLFNQIDDMEKRHHLNRRQHMLREAEPVPDDAPAPQPMNAPDIRKSEGSSFLWIVALWAAFSQPKPNHK